MPQVQISPTFWKKEREQAYSNPPVAVWRELFQNSIDQAVTAIDIGLTDSADGSFVQLTFADNGPGMSRDVLENVYFQIGNSTKDQDPTKIGGMGRARILTCFAMQAYRILSQDYEVVGRGGHYDVLDHVHTEGCKLIIEVDGYSLTTMQNALETFLTESRIPARVTVNGQRIGNKSAYPGRHVRDLVSDGKAFAKVWVNKSHKSKRVIIRVNGVSMFSSSTEANAQVLVELDPSMSRNVLTANRDGLRSIYAQVLARFLRELSINTSDALNSRFGKHTTVHRAGGMKVVRAKQVDQKTKRQSLQNQVVIADKTPDLAAFTSNDVKDDDFSEVTYTEVQSFDSWFEKTFGDIYIFDEAESSAMRKNIPAYDPRSWQIVYGPYGDRPYRKGGNILRVLLLWQTAVSYTIEVALNSLGKTSIPYAVGFLFSEAKLAMCHDQDGGHVFCLRPVNAEGKLDYLVSKRRDLKRLMTYAKHEVTHIDVSWHGESFTSLREAIDIEFDEMECLRRMKAALQQLKDF
jgi:hypothetical protein